MIIKSLSAIYYYSVQSFWSEFKCHFPRHFRKENRLPSAVIYACQKIIQAINFASVPSFSAIWASTLLPFFTPALSIYTYLTSNDRLATPCKYNWRLHRCCSAYTYRLINSNSNHFKEALKFYLDVTYRLSKCAIYSYFIDLFLFYSKV